MDISLEMAADVLGDTIRNTTRLLTIESIQKLIAQDFSLSFDLITGESRRHEVAEARHIAMYLCKHLTSSSLKTIGINFNGRDHSTVIHSVKKVEKKMKSNLVFSKLIKTLIYKAKNPE